MFDSGKTVLGSSQAPVTPDIVLYGPGIDECHCYVVVDDSCITLYPLAVLTSVDGVRVSSPTRLYHSKFHMFHICISC